MRDIEKIIVDKDLTETQSKVTSLKDTQPGVNYDAVFEVLRTLNEATLMEVKDANIRTKRGFEGEKKHIAKHLTVLQDEITKLDTSLTDVTSTFVQMGQDFNATLDRVAEGVRKDVRASIGDCVDDQMTSLKSSLNSKLSDLEGKVFNMDNNISNMKSSLTSKYSDVEEKVANVSNKMAFMIHYLTTALTRVEGQLTRITKIGSQTNEITEVMLSHVRDGYFFPQNDYPKIVRLANTTVESTWVIGRLEVFRSGSWGTVCDDSFVKGSARVACNMFIPYVQSVDVFGNAAYGQGSGPILLDDVICSGWEKSLWSCVSSFPDCGHSEDVAIKCSW